MKKTKIFLTAAALCMGISTLAKTDTAQITITYQGPGLAEDVESDLVINSPLTYNQTIHFTNPLGVKTPLPPFPDQAIRQSSIAYWEKGTRFPTKCLYSGQKKIDLVDKEGKHLSSLNFKISKPTVTGGGALRYDCEMEPTYQ